jgi:hypothetical protein
MSDEQRSDANSVEVSADKAVVPAFELDPTLFKRESWELVLSEDGWYLMQEAQAPRRISVADAVAQFGKNGRGAVFRATRMYIADLGREIGEKAWLSPTAPSPLREKGLDPKLPADQIARAGHIIGRLADELRAAEDQPV